MRIIYACFQGHEITLRVLYRLFGEAEEDRDFFSSTTATSVYETFLLHVVHIMSPVFWFVAFKWMEVLHLYNIVLFFMQSETLRDSFPASDKSLNRLLGEVPYLPNSIIKLLEFLCSPGCSADDKELHGGDRVTQGLSIVWSLILLRPPIRDATLKIALKVFFLLCFTIQLLPLKGLVASLYFLYFLLIKV